MNINLTNILEKQNEISSNVLITLEISAIVLILLLSIATIYLIFSLRRKTVVLKKVDYLVEDLTYKSESLNVTVETINKASSYLSSLDVVTQNGFKSAIKLLAENKNYIYSITEKIKSGVEERENLEKKENSKKTTKKTNTNTKKTSQKKPKPSAKQQKQQKKSKE